MCERTDTCASAAREMGRRMEKTKPLKPPKKRHRDCNEQAIGSAMRAPRVYFPLSGGVGSRQHLSRRTDCCQRSFLVYCSPPEGGKQPRGDVWPNKRQRDQTDEPGSRIKASKDKIAAKTWDNRCRKDEVLHTWKVQKLREISSRRCVTQSRHFARSRTKLMCLPSAQDLVVLTTRGVPGLCFFLSFSHRYSSEYCTRLGGRAPLSLVRPEVPHGLCPSSGWEQRRENAR